MDGGVEFCDRGSIVAKLLKIHTKHRVEIHEHESNLQMLQNLQKGPKLVILELFEIYTHYKAQENEI